jgi:hypothetical protein
MEFLTLGFWWWAIRVLIPFLSFMVLVFAISPTMCFELRWLNNGIGPSWKELESKRDQLLASTSRVDRGFNKALFAMADNRPLTAGASGVALILSLLLW